MVDRLNVISDDVRHLRDGVLCDAGNSTSTAVAEKLE
jgi:hypothetical protein